jgi:hypothetical protein
LSDSSTNRSSAVHIRLISAAMPAFLGLLLGCTSSTAPDPVTATIREVSLLPDAGVVWPQTPTMFGGAVVTIRGTAEFGCGTAAVVATRAGADVDVVVQSNDADRPCVATIMGWRPYEVQVAGLAAGRYRVRARVVGLVGEASWEVGIVAR